MTKYSMKFDQAVQRFRQYLKFDRRLAENTVSGYLNDLKQFVELLQPEYPGSVSEDDILKYIQQMKAGGLSIRSQQRKLSALKAFYRFLVKSGVMEENPMSLIMAPGKVKSLPKTLNEGEVEKLLAAPDSQSAMGMRDKAMFELLYATGLRVTELVQLKISEIHFEPGYLLIMGKGRKQRAVPFGESARVYLKKYLELGRPQVMKLPVDGVFLSRFGKPMTRQAFWQMIKKYALQVGLERAKVSPHVLRHCFATHLLNHGSDLRSIQMMLGHENLSTTEIYTAVSHERLKKLHAQYHPLAQEGG